MELNWILGYQDVEMHSGSLGTYGKEIRASGGMGKSVDLMSVVSAGEALVF